MGPVVLPDQMRGVATVIHDAYVGSIHGACHGPRLKALARKSPAVQKQEARVARIADRDTKMRSSHGQGIAAISANNTSSSGSPPSRSIIQMSALAGARTLKFGSDEP